VPLDPTQPEKQPWWLDRALSRIDAALSRAAGAYRDVPKEPTREEPKKEWYAVVCFTELTKTGAKARVVESFDDLNKAEMYRDRHKSHALYPVTFAERPEKGTPLDIKKGSSEARDITRQFRVLQWHAEQGKHYVTALWNETREVPRTGQAVHFTTGIDYRGEPVGRLANPLSPSDPGQPKAARPVVIEKDPKTPWLGRIVEMPRTMAEAINRVKELDIKKDQDIKKNQEEQQRQDWVPFGEGGKLRDIAKELTGRDAKLTVTSHDLAGRQVDVVRRLDEQGLWSRSYIVTQQTTDEHGKPRTDSRVFTSQEVKARHEANQARAREATHQPRAPEQTRPPLASDIAPRRETHQADAARARQVEQQRALEHDQNRSRGR
jgi:hypothetical protein